MLPRDRTQLLARRALLGVALAALALLPVRGHAQAPPMDLAAFETLIHNLINQQRQANGRKALRRDTRLDSAARTFSQYMGTARFFDHVGPDRVPINRRLERAGYRPLAWWGENIAVGYDSAEELVADWMASASHRANILNKHYKDDGVGV